MPTLTPTHQPSKSPTIQPTKNPTPSPVEEGVIGGNDDILTTEENKQNNQDGFKGNIGNTGINWADMHHVMFYIIISVLVCIICVMSFVFTMIRKKDKIKYNALKRVSSLALPSTSNVNVGYNTLAAHSPRNTEMTNISDMGNIQAMWAASSPIEIINTNDLPPENIAIAEDDDGNDNNNVQYIINNTHGINEGNETHESEEDDELGLYQNNTVTPINPKNNIVDITPQ
eukprot:476304_1